jgi:hypothetical protein
MGTPSYNLRRVRKLKRIGGLAVEAPVSQDSLFYKVTTILSIATTAGLALLALLFSSAYNEREARRDEERESYQRDRDRLASRQSCLDFEIALARETPIEDNQPLRIAMARSIDFRVTHCHRIGYEVDRRQALALLDRVARGASGALASEVARARSAVRSPAPVTPMQRAEAYELLSTDYKLRNGVVEVAAYGGGAFLSGTGLLEFRRHVDRPSQNDLRKVIDPGALGVGLLAFPAMNGFVSPDE